MRILRTAKTFVFFVLPATALVASGSSLFGPAMHAQQAPAKSAGLDMTALDKTADACTDFYQYACGGWMATHPIPADQSSWGRANELTSATRRRSGKSSRRPRRIRRRIPTRAENRRLLRRRAWTTAPRPEGTLGGAAGAGSHRRRWHKPAIASPKWRGSIDGRVTALFDFGSQARTSRTRPGQIAHARAGRSGLPDRDYYLKDDARSQELRKKYGAHVSKMLTSPTNAPTRRGRRHEASCRSRPRWQKVRIDRVMRRDPVHVYHKMTRKELISLTPRFRLAGAISTAVGAGVHRGQRRLPDFFRAPTHSSRPRRAWTCGRYICTGTCCTRRPLPRSNIRTTRTSTSSAGR